MRHLVGTKTLGLAALLAFCARLPVAAGPEQAAREGLEGFSAGLGVDAAGLRSAMKAADAAAAARTVERKAAAPFVPSKKTLHRFQQKRFPAPAAGACGLKSFTVLDYEARSRDTVYESARISLMGAVIETTSPDCIRDYGVVQFIRGCAYHVRYDLATGAERERTFDIARRLRGPRVVFSHPEWEVDSNDEDPLYAGSPEVEDRLGLSYVPDSPLRLKPDARSMRADLEILDTPARRSFLMDQEKPAPMVFVTDVPDGGVSAADEEGKGLTATNTSLEFRTCLYRLKDVPTSGSPAGEGVAPESGGPLQCFGWASRYTYDPSSGDFETDRYQGVDPFCSQAPARVPLPG